MIRPIMKDIMFLAQPCEKATPEDRQVIIDLVDTLNSHCTRCVGMAANMIGVRKRIIAVEVGPMVLVMINPVIVTRKGEYETDESCLSLTGSRKCKRYQEIEVSYQDTSFLPRRQKYSGMVAEIIQHEIDHCNGVII